MREIVTRTTGKAPEEKGEQDDDEGYDSSTLQTSRRGGRDSQDSRGRDRDRDRDRDWDRDRDGGGGGGGGRGGASRRARGSERGSDDSLERGSGTVGGGGTNSDSDNDMIGLAPDPDSDSQVDDERVGEVGDGAGKSRKLVRKASFEPGYQAEVGAQKRGQERSRADVLGGV